MQHLPDLIQDLGLILVAAATVSLLFKWLKQPLVLGYLVAGFLVGPSFQFFPTVKDQASITTWAEIGVIFILFGLGLEFSFKKLKAVGRSAVITAAVEISLMLGLGYVVGRSLGWARMDSMFLGGMLSISSTTIIVKSIEELGLKGRNFVSLVFGVLVVEDLVAVLLLVLLSSIAITQTVSGTELVYSSLKLVFFILLWFVLGIYLLPALLRQIRSLLNDESEVIISLGLCLLMVMIASQVGFSPALGAFVMGSILAETPKGKHIEHLLNPIRSLFSAVFLVSVGMMIELSVIQEYWHVILLLSSVIIFGKFTGVTIGAIVSGRSLKNSVQAGVSLTQIGEFSFIIATLGVTLGVTSSYLYPIAVVVSALTTFTTPIFMKNMDRIFNFIHNRLPPNLKLSLQNYELLLATKAEQKIYHILWNEYGMRTLLNAVMVVGVTLLFSRIWLPRFGHRFVQLPFPVEYLFLGTSLLVSMPFLWAIFVGSKQLIRTYDSEISDQLRKISLAVNFVRFLMGLALVGFVVKQFTSIWAFTGMIVLLISLLGVLLLMKFFRPIYLLLEKRFLFHLSDEGQELQPDRRKTPRLAPWSANLVELVVSANSPLIGLKLEDSKVKEQFGVTIAMIERGKKRILSPKRDDLLLPQDRVFLIGTEEQILNARKVVEQDLTVELDPLPDSFGLTSIQVLESDFFVNKPIRECGLRESIEGMIVGIEREGERILNPHSNLEIKAKDLLWLVGNLDLIKKLRA